MLNNNEIKLISEILKGIELDGEKDILKKKLSLIVEQIELMEKATKEVEEVSKKIMELEGEENDGRN